MQTLPEVKIHCTYSDLMDVEKVIPNPKNPNKHSDKQIKMLAAIIKGHGWRAPITVSRRSGFVVRGHGRLMAAKLLGMEQVPVDLQEYDSEASEWADMIADNRIAELSEIDQDELRDLVLELESEIDAALLGFTEKDIQSIVNQSVAGELHEDDFTGEDIAEILGDEKLLVCPGDVWELGRHRLLCGSCTNLNSIEKIMDGDLADMIFTDPPYNVNYEGGTDEKLKIQNDNMNAAEFNQMLYDAFTGLFTVSKPGAAIYICHADSEGSKFRETLLSSGWYHKQTLIWAKNTFTLGRQDYQWQHEPILYGWKPGAAHTFYGGRKQGTVVDVGYPVEIQEHAGENGETYITIGGGLSDIVLEINGEVKIQNKEEVTTLVKVDKPVRNGEHPTMKPILLCGKCIANSTAPDDIVIDFFGGSGSTLIACEQLGRQCRMMELDPKYCEVIIRRWEEFTGKKAIQKKGKRE